MSIDSGTLGNTLYGAMPEFNHFTDISGLGSNMQAFSGGGKKKGSKKKGVKKKGEKKTPMRKQLSRKTKSMSKMRIRNVKKLTKRQKKLEKHLKHRKIRNNIINSIASTNELPKEVEVSLSPSMLKFISKIPRDSSQPSSLSSWPSLDFDEVQSVAHKGKPSTKSFEDARKGLADILKKKPVYPVKSKSVIKFSDYKSKMKPKEKAALKAKSKKKGRTR